VKTVFDSVAAPPPIQSTKLDPGDRLSGVPATGPWSISHHAGHEASICWVCLLLHRDWGRRAGWALVRQHLCI